MNLVAMNLKHKALATWLKVPLWNEWSMNDFLFWFFLIFNYLQMSAVHQSWDLDLKGAWKFRTIVKENNYIPERLSVTVAKIKLYSTQSSKFSWLTERPSFVHSLWLQTRNLIIMAYRRSGKMKLRGVSIIQTISLLYGVFNDYASHCYLTFLRLLNDYITQYLTKHNFIALCCTAIREMSCSDFTEGLREYVLKRWMHRVILLMISSSIVETVILLLVFYTYAMHQALVLQAVLR